MSHPPTHPVPVEAEVIDEPHALVPVDRTREVIRPLDAADVVAAMREYQELVPRLLDSTDRQDAGGGRSFVKKSGWRKIARAFNLSCELVRCEVTRDEDGTPVRAEAVVRALAPNGVHQDGDGYCAADEPRFSKTVARQKLENDLRATATTRAKNRAISDLVGMGEVSAEEADAHGDGLSLPQHARPASKVANGRAADAAVALLTGHLPPDAAVAAADAVLNVVRGESGGTIPRGTARALLHLAVAARADTDTNDPPTPTPTTENDDA